MLLHTFLNAVKPGGLNHYFGITEDLIFTKTKNDFSQLTPQESSNPKLWFTLFFDAVKPGGLNHYFGISQDPSSPFMSKNYRMGWISSWITTQRSVIQSYASSQLSQ
jgi:hypothetical protein